MTTLGATDNAVRWLEQLFRGRISEDLVLAKQHDEQGEYLYMRVNGSPGFIRFGAALPAFYRKGDPGDALPCGTWCAEDEGFSSLLGDPLPLPGRIACDQALIGPVAREGESGWHINHDLPGFFYWTLARIEEIGRFDLDVHQRFPATASHAFRNGYLDRPVVDEWMDILRQLCCRQWPGLVLKEAAFGVVVSHDVDSPSRYAYASFPEVLRAIASAIKRERRFLSLFEVPWIRLTARQRYDRRDPFNTFDWLMQQSDRHGLTSAFYFICGNTEPSRDARYTLEDPRIRALMRDIAAKGHEIGLHPSYNTFRCPTAIRQEADSLRQTLQQEKIDQASIGGRMHYLRWDQSVTLRALDDADMAYDTTLGYADHAGFRCGTCHEYAAFDPVEDKALAIRIRPLVAMEVTVMGPQYMGLNGDAALATFAQLKQRCRAVQGSFTLLWHNSSFLGDADFRLYKQILEA